MQCRWVALLTPIEVAAILNCSKSSVLKRDAELQPRRTPTGRRIYESAIIDRVAAERAAKKKPLAARRDAILARVDHLRGRK